MIGLLGLVMATDEGTRRRYRLVAATDLRVDMVDRYLAVCHQRALSPRNHKGA